MHFTPEHRALADTVTRFVEKELNPYVPQWEADEIYPAHEVFAKLGKLGLLGLKYPEEYGGAGLDFSYSVTMAEALGECACGGVPMSIGVQTDMCTPALARFGLDDPLTGEPASIAALVRFEAARNREWFERGLALTALLDARSTACVLAMSGIYRAVLARIEEDPLAVTRGRVALSGWEKTRVAARSLVESAT